MRPRSRARGWALQALYAWEARRNDVTLDETLRQFMVDRNIAADSREYLRRLLQLIEDNADEIDGVLESALRNWRLERLSVIDRNVLRIGAAELLYMPDVPERVAIQEAIILAEKYGTVESPRFVNGVLDALMRRVRPSGTDASGEARP
ncbi:MAG TPA: transcription antitermination factor NusB [Longimicrobiales bacterium]|nr:transcription antitermination factor NusB [Longimicrobiales bacterium]